LTHYSSFYGEVDAVLTQTNVLFAQMLLSSSDMAAFIFR